MARQWGLILITTIILGTIALGIAVNTTNQDQNNITVSNFTLSSISGESVEFNDHKDDLKLVSWIYTQCLRGCATVNTEMLFLYSQLVSLGYEDTIAFFAIDIDYLVDDAQDLQNYAKTLTFGKELPAEFYFLYGNEEEITSVTTNWGYDVRLGDPEDVKQEEIVYYCGGVYHNGTPDVVWIHPFEVYLVDGNNQLVHTYSALTWSNSEVLSDMMDLLQK